MKMLCLAAALAALAGPALGQTSHQNHAGGSAPHPAPYGPAAPHGHGAPHASTAPHTAPHAAAPASEAVKAYEGAMERMHGPMMEGVRDPDPDVAFVRGMIPHHQGAIEMARVVLQHGRDEQARKWATDVIREQAREIAEMQAWLKARGK